MGVRSIELVQHTLKTSSSLKSLKMTMKKNDKKQVMTMIMMKKKKKTLRR